MSPKTSSEMAAEQDERRESRHGPTPRCSIIVRAYNEERHIGRLLAGILEQNVSDVEIILVDSGSTDATVAIASRFPVRIVTIDPEEFTFGRSLNIGCRAARGEFLVMVSAHAYPVYSDWLEKLLAPFEDHRVALTYGKQRGDQRTRFSEQQVFKKWFPDRSNLRQQTPFCNNANAAIRRDLWIQHPYDESLSGLEDLAWAIWALQQGYHLAYVAEAEVVHVHQEAPHQVRNRYRREAMALAQLRPQAKLSFWDVLKLWGGNVISDFWHAAQEGKLRRAAPGILQFRSMQFLGTYQGFRTTALTDELKYSFYYPLSPRSPQAATRRDGTPIRYGQATEHGGVAADQGDP